jgi:flagellar basal body-associated protein FliL
MGLMWKIVKFIICILQISASSMFLAQVDKSKLLITVIPALVLFLFMSLGYIFLFFNSFTERVSGGHRLGLFLVACMSIIIFVSDIMMLNNENKGNMKDTTNILAVVSIIFSIIVFVFSISL